MWSTEKYRTYSYLRTNFNRKISLSITTLRLNNPVFPAEKAPGSPSHLLVFPVKAVAKALWSSVTVALFLEVDSMTSTSQYYRTTTSSSTQKVRQRTQRCTWPSQLARQFALEKTRCLVLVTYKCVRFFCPVLGLIAGTLTTCAVRPPLKRSDRQWPASRSISPDGLPGASSPFLRGKIFTERAAQMEQITEHYYRTSDLKLNIRILLSTLHSNIKLIP